MFRDTSKLPKEKPDISAPSSGAKNKYVYAFLDVNIELKWISWINSQKLGGADSLVCFNTVRSRWKSLEILDL